jgi:hypothetical protein
MRLHTTGESLAGMGRFADAKAEILAIWHLRKRALFIRLLRINECYPNSSPTFEVPDSRPSGNFFKRTKHKSTARIPFT